ncbi:hypothetical protein ASU31_04860 [Pedobacter ginsenosidimutans]|uniref:DUF5008 domain-containing protein n=1 Tax=Pedobacter ginsenosidimutans TaxID=687842 RepID=A0A0T5VU01_9SPHI|nr:DUF5008 domain-containing protein [Pedobacter ginsenosidimutans]KRT17012.1 hypothetical protein ASU31_04860 [Pedobacter ginsenosidimutans]
MKKIKYMLIVFFLCSLVIQGCKKEEELGEDPYADGKAPLGITISQTLLPVPSEGIVGTTVTIQAKGLMPFKDKLTFMFNGEKAEVLSVTESTIVVKVPEAGSTGITSIAIGDQLILGPQFIVSGLIKNDITFKATAGTNGYVNQFYEMLDGRAIVLGSFNNYNNNGFITPNNRIVRTSLDGDYDRTFRTGRGANGSLSRVIEIGGRFIIAGGFSGYNQRTENISNITSLYPNGAIDTIKIQTKRKPTLTDTVTQKWFPKFNGGTNEYINRIYPHQGKILATGNFRYYVKRTYDKDNYDFSRDTVILDSTEIRQILRFNLDGSLDKTYRFNTATNKGNVSANGPIDTYMHTDAANLEKLMVFGNFSTFDDQPAVRILRLNADGTKDPSFNPGSGVDNGITSLTYNATTRKYLITGAFTKYNGKPVYGMALINEDGSLDESFTAKFFEGGYPYFARQISNGLIVVSGGFKKYNNITRNGFMVLTPAGLLAPGYNATGPFSGGLSDVIETKSADGKKALLLIGGFNRFDNQPFYNIVRVTIE